MYHVFTRVNSCFFTVSNRQTFLSSTKPWVIERREEGNSIRVYDREATDTGICIVLFHDVEKAQVDGSRLGLSIGQALTTFGIVHHSVWIEGQ